MNIKDVDLFNELLESKLLNLEEQKKLIDLLSNVVGRISIESHAYNPILSDVYPLIMMISHLEDDMQRFEQKEKKDANI